MRVLYILCVIFSLPFLAVLGHDLYMSYNNPNLDINNPVMFSDLGWLWLQYNEEGYRWTRANVDAAIWSDIIDPLLEQRAILITIIPVAFFVGLIILFKIIQMGPWNANVRLRGRSGSGKDFSFREKAAAKGRTKYKRK